MNEVLKLEHIQKYYGSKGNVTKAIQDISFSVQEGEFVGIMGASGSGKTTLLNCISTIDTVSAGHIYLDGTDVTEINEKEIARFRRENLGFVFQDFNLLDTLTISENIALALTINQVPAGKIDGRVREMAAKLNITDILDKYPYQVSGGQKQRCACARAIINQPKLILADEPTGALDSHSSQMLLSMPNTAMPTKRIANGLLQRSSAFCRMKPILAHWYRGSKAPHITKSSRWSSGHPLNGFASLTPMSH